MIKFLGIDPKELHHCTSYRDGDWIVWHCPHCEDFERRFNWRTGEMMVKGKGMIRHTGFSDSIQNLASLRIIPKEQEQ